MFIISRIAIMKVKRIVEKAFTALKIALGLIGAVLVYLSIGSADYHILAVRDGNTGDSITMLIIGVVLSLPAIVSLFRYILSDE